MKLALKLATAALAAAIGLSLPAFANSVKVDYNHHIDFSQFHTYSWKTVDVTNQLNAGRIQRAVDDELQRRGWKEVSSGGQITLVATDHMHTETEAETYYNGLGGGWGMGWGWGGWGSPGGGFGEEATTATDVIRQTHLVVDMFNAQSKVLIWRGVSRGDLSDKSGKNRKQLYKDLHTMFRNFPAKVKK